MSERVPDGRKMVIYERFFSPDRVYTIEEAYAFIEKEAPSVFTPRATAAFQRKVDERFPRVPLDQAAGL
jgi:hypothetical protein